MNESVIPHWIGEPSLPEKVEAVMLGSKLNDALAGHQGIICANALALMCTTLIGMTPHGRSTPEDVMGWISTMALANLPHLQEIKRKAEQ